MGRHVSSLGISAIIGPVVLVLFALVMIFIGLRPYIVHYDTLAHAGFLEYLKMNDEKFFIYFILTPVFLLGWLAFSYFIRVQAILINGASIMVVRNLRSVTINLFDVVSVASFRNNELRFAQYTGTLWKRGLVGFCGNYFKKDFGDMQWYCNKSSDHVMLILKDGRKVVFTPDDRDAFVNEIMILRPDVSVVS
jgi:hypothetical protein